MNKRDLQIINDLERFRVLSRNDIIDLYFNHLKNPVTSANIVLKRLVRDKQIDVSTSFSPYVYFPIQSTMKRNSTKIPHFLSIVQVYKDIKKYYTPDVFEVEPKYKKGLAEPDAYTRVNGARFFIEVQRNEYSQRVMDDKIKRYEALYYEAKGQLPFIVMISNIRYEINSDFVTVFQVDSMHEFMERIKERDPKPKKEIKKKNGGGIIIQLA